MCKYIMILFSSDPYPDLYNALFAYDVGYDLVIPVPNVTSKNFEEIFIEAYFGRRLECSKNTVFFLNIRPQSELEKAIDILNNLRSKQITPTIIIDPRGAYTTAAAIAYILQKAVNNLALNLSSLSMTVLGGAGNVGAAVVKLLCEKLKETIAIDKDKLRIEDLKKDLQNASCNIRFIQTSDKADFVEYCRNADIVVSTGPPKVNFLSINDLAESKCKIAIDIDAVPPSGILGIKPDDNNTQREGISCFGYKIVGKIKRKIQEEILIKAKATLGRIFDLNEIARLDIE